MSRILRLPDHGRLLVCTDLQGCLRDFRTMEEHFRRLHSQCSDAHLLFTGDLVHGPYLEEENWPEYLGEYYQDASGELIDAFVELRHEFPNRVFALMGNHEHGHVGGPHTAKFARDEVARLETHLGPKRSAHLRAVLSGLPLVAVAPCGAVFTHGAPSAKISRPADIERAELNSEKWGSATDALAVPVIGPILWSRSAPESVARNFAEVLGGRFTIYGHDVIPEGYQRVGEEQMVVSTSFGVFDRNKVYVSLDLTESYGSVMELEPGSEILPLYPPCAS